MELFRSEAMQLVQLIVPAEAAHETVEELGQIGLVQFKDLNEEQSAFQRNYAVQETEAEAANTAKGEQARAKIAKICEAFDANLYPYPEDFSRQGEMHAEVNERLHELSYAIEAGQGQWEDTVSAIASELSTWIDIVTREAAIYHILNMFSIDVTRKCLIAEGWIPADSKRLIQVMFGDVGHGLLLTLAAGALVLWERKLGSGKLNEMMTLGILISFFNQRFFRDRLSMVCEFVPQILFLSCLFGYLSFLIMLKWLTG
eukprot:jgi/Pico_ML_1/50781/g1929.t2